MIVDDLISKLAKFSGQAEITGIHVGPLRENNTRPVRFFAESDGMSSTFELEFTPARKPIPSTKPETKEVLTQRPFSGLLAGLLK